MLSVLVFLRALYFGTLPSGGWHAAVNGETAILLHMFPRHVLRIPAPACHACAVGYISLEP